VKRAIKAAVDRGFLVLRPHVDAQLQEELHRRRPLIRFHVVQDTFHPFEDETPLGHDPVCRKAALVIGERIAALLRDRPGDAPILIGNGGGLTLRNTIELLAADVHDAPTVPGRLRFISLNGATWADIYDRSANYLAVRCSESYDGRHIAVVRGWTPEMRQQYLEAIRNLDLLILAAGSKASSFLSAWLGRLNPPLALGADFIGDVSYIPLKANGDELECLPEVRAAIQELQPALSYVSLLRYAGEGKVILVLSDHRNVRSPAVPKLEMAQAIIRANLTTDLILGRSLATPLAATMEGDDRPPGALPPNVLAPSGG
jgi:hypothetical protein